MRLCFGVLLAIPLLGCGGSDDAGRTAVYPVRGKIVTAAGPLADASVVFAPKSGQPTATGRTNAQGEYTLTTYEAGDGAAAGEYGVVVTKTTQAEVMDEDAGHAAYAAGGADTGHDAAGGGGAVLLVPPQYASATDTPLSATVDPDESNEFDFTIK